MFDSIDSGGQTELNIVWSPLPGSQTLALCCPAQIIIYHGTRGPGKTDAQLMRFRRNVGQGFGKFWRGIIFDREYKNLDDLVSKSQRWFPEFHDGAKFSSSKADYKWVWPTGEELLFRAVKKDSDYWGYHGQEFPFIGWNELTKYPNENLFDMMMSCNRSSYLPPNHVIDDGFGNMILPSDIPLEVFCTCNPYGVGHNWVKKRFISPAGMGKIQVRVVNVYNPRTQRREDIKKTQVHLFGSYRENKYLSPEYIAELETITDVNKRKAWLQGDWDVLAGGMFDGDWDSEYHILEPFMIPHSWKIDRSFDYGSSKPFSVGWWAESDGTEYIDSRGRTIQTVKGDLFRIHEWYGANDKKPNVGIRMLADAIARGIVERELAFGIYNRVKPGPADNSIWDEDDGKSIAKTMYEKVRLNGKMYKGISWRRSNKNPGSRKLGWEECRKMLENAKRPFILAENGTPIYSPREKPGLFCFSRCTHFIELFPTLPRDEKDPDDVDTESEDHIGDETRYKVLDITHPVESQLGYAQ